MRRGDVVVVALPGDYGKPRPAIIVQSNVLNDRDPPSYLVCPLSTMLSGQADLRIAVEPEPGNGLNASSEVMVDKTSPAPSRRIRAVVGRLDPATMRLIDRALLLVLGFA